MAAYTDIEDFKAYNMEQREIRSKAIVYFPENTIECSNTDMLISWSINQSLTDSLDTPFDKCCADTCTLTVYNRYTGIYDNEQVTEFKIFDPLKNVDAALNLKFKIQVSAKRNDGDWSPWVTLGIFYTTEIKINDDRSTATLQADDLLSLVFNKSLPAIPVLKHKTFKEYIMAFCEMYDLPVDWQAGTGKYMKYAYCQSTTKDTIQQLVSSAATCATIVLDENDEETLKVIPFADFMSGVPFTVVDYSNFGAEETKMQFFSLQYNKTLQSYADNTKIVWYLPSISDVSSLYEYNTDNLADFTYDTEAQQYEMHISRAAMSQHPMNNIDYMTTCSPYADGANFGVGIGPSKFTQFNFTGVAKCRSDIPEDYTYSIHTQGRYINTESQELPQDVPEGEVQTLNEYLSVDLPYVHSKQLATLRKAMLDAWANCTLQTINISLRYNPYIPLSSLIFIDAQVYDVPDFTGVLWTQVISYTGGALQSDAVLVNKAAFSTGIQVYDVAGYQGASDAAMNSIYMIGMTAQMQGIWRVDTRTADDASSYELVGKIRKKFTDAAITFDGTWQLSSNGELYTLATEAVPWIFTITNGKLYGQHGAAATRVLLADDAIYCAAERGYYPRDFGSLLSDQGVIVAYMDSEHRVFYRTYALTETGKRWEAAEQIGLYTGGTATSIQIHRLNDYRIGIVITAATGNTWLITDRVYSQMAIRPEIANVKATEVDTPLLCCIRLDGIDATPQPNFTWSIYEDNRIITIVSDMSLSIDDTLQSRISGTENMPAVASVSQTANEIIIT